jgi:hypothetical protein
MMNMKNRMFQPHILNRSVVVLMALLAQQQVLGSDSSIYINPGETQATSTAMFLLDNSGSMVYDNSYDAVVNPEDNSIDVRLNRLKKPCNGSWWVINPAVSWCQAAVRTLN